MEQGLARAARMGPFPVGTEVDAGRGRDEGGVVRSLTSDLPHPYTKHTNLRAISDGRERKFLLTES